MDSTSLASQFSGLAVGGGTTPNQRLRNKRSQRFTVPVQHSQQSQQVHAPPHPAGSPPFSNSDESASMAGSGGSSMVSDAQNLSQQSMLHGTSNNNLNSHDLFPVTSSGSTTSPFPSNFAQTGIAGPPSFLQQDPFAFVGSSNAAARQRTLSAGSQSQHQQQQHQPQQQQQQSQAWVMPNAGYGSGATNPFNAFQSAYNGVNQSLFSPQSTSPYGLPEQQLPSQHYQQQQQQTHSSADDIIPTAIVVKNIPFNFPSTSLLQIIEELTLSPPYAFNYHYDNGTFRGLAFANFHTAQETDACVVALNGFEIAGRKLRVEYKKVLQAGEKERIERDKAIKRMRSMQLDRERMINHQQQQQHAQGQQQLHQMQQGYNHNFGVHQQQSSNGQHQQLDEYEDYGHQILPSNATSFFAANNAQIASPPLSHASHTISTGPGSVASSSDAQLMQNGNSFHSHLNGASNASTRSGQQAQLQQQQQPSGSGSSSLPYELDMNDPVTLELYSRVLLFKDDALRDELAFPRSLTSVQRRIVHLVAKRLGLEHRSVGTGEDRLVVVVKPPSSNGDAGGEHRSLRTRASAHHLIPSPDPYSLIGGGNGGGFNHADSGISLLGGGGMGGIGNSLAASAALRKKSMPDLRHQQTHPNPSMINTSNLSGLGNNGSMNGFGQNVMSPPLPSAGSGGSNGSTTSGVATRHSNHDLRRPRSAFYGAADFSIPPVPALPTTLPTSAIATSAGNANGIATSSPRLANRHSMLFNQAQQSLGSLDLGDNTELTNKAVGSPISAGATRQPRGPDGTSSWARVASVAANGTA